MAAQRWDATARDASMRAHDAFAIPLPTLPTLSTLRRHGSAGSSGTTGRGGEVRGDVSGITSADDADPFPNTLTPGAVTAIATRLVAERSPAALLRLRALLAERPDAVPATAIALRRALAGKSSTDPEAALDAVQYLMETSPYFYRYIANDKFFDALWKLANVDLHRARILGLIRDWALALKVQYPRRETDPAATFWKDKYDVLYKCLTFPEPTFVFGRQAVCAVCPTSLSDRRRHPILSFPVVFDFHSHREGDNSSGSSGQSGELAKNAGLESLLPPPLWRTQRRATRRVSCSSVEDAKTSGYRRLLPSSRPCKRSSKEVSEDEKRFYEVTSSMLESMSPISDDDDTSRVVASAAPSSALCRDSIPGHVMCGASAGSMSSSSVAAMARGRARERLSQSAGVDVGRPAGPLHGVRKHSDGPLAKLLQGPSVPCEPTQSGTRMAADPGAFALEVDGLDDYVPREPSQFSLYAGASEAETELGTSV
jgi:hypothetical protein